MGHFKIKKVDTSKELKAFDTAICLNMSKNDALGGDLPGPVR